MTEIIWDKLSLKENRSRHQIIGFIFFFFYVYIYQYISTAVVLIHVIMVDGVRDSDMEDLDVYAIEGTVVDYVMVRIFILSILYTSKLECGTN